MTSAARVFLLIFATLLINVVAALWLNTSEFGPAISLLINIAAAPFGQKLISWIDAGTTEVASADIEPKSSTRIIYKTHDTNQSKLVLYIFLINFYSLLISAIANQVLIQDIETLKEANLLEISDLGFSEFQKYSSGLTMMMIWAPAIHMFCFYLGGSKQIFTFLTFFWGWIAAIPTYFIVARSLGLPIGIGDPNAAPQALGSHLPTIGGYDGFIITSFLMQAGALLLLTVALSIYAWLSAWTSRGAVRLASIIWSYFLKLLKFAQIY